MTPKELAAIYMMSGEGGSMYWCQNCKSTGRFYGRSCGCFPRRPTMYVHKLGKRIIVRAYTNYPPRQRDVLWSSDGT